MEKKLAEAEKKSREDAEERKTMKAKLDLVTGFMSSNPLWHEYLSQAGSQHVDGSASGSAGGSGSRRGDEDGSGDDEGSRDDHE